MRCHDTVILNNKDKLTLRYGQLVREGQKRRGDGVSEIIGLKIRDEDT